MVASGGRKEAMAERTGVRARAVISQCAALYLARRGHGGASGTGAERALWAKKRGGASGTARSAACGTTMQVPRTDEAGLRTPGRAGHKR